MTISPKMAAYRKVLPHFTEELNAQFDNDLYRDSQTYSRLLYGAKVHKDMDKIKQMEGDLLMVAAFAKLRGLSLLEQYAREIIRLF